MQVVEKPKNGVEPTNYQDSDQPFFFLKPLSVFKNASELVSQCPFFRFFLHGF